MNTKPNKYRVKLENARWQFDRAETALHDAWSTLSFLGEDDALENKAFELYTEAEAFAADLRAICKEPDSKSMAELRKKLSRLRICRQRKAKNEHTN